MARSASDRVFAKSFDVVYMIGNEMHTGVKFGDGIYLEDMDTSKPMVIPHGIEDTEVMCCFILLKLLASRDVKLYMTKVSEVAKRKAQAASCAAWPFPTAKSIGADEA
jgi:hypothetical protein